MTSAVDEILASPRKLSRLSAAMAHARERQEIWNRRAAGMQKPWTDDPVLRDRWWGNAFRELDKTTAWGWEQLRGRELASAIVGAIALRLTNRAGTLAAMGWLPKASGRDCSRWVEEFRAQPAPRWLTVYKVNWANRPGFGRGSDATEMLADALQEAARRARDVRERDLRGGPGPLVDICRGVGEFVANEVFHDLAHAGLCRVGTWANAGPGARSGLLQVLTGELAAYGSKERKGREAIERGRAAVAELTLRQAEVFEATGGAPRWDGTGGAPPLAEPPAVSARFFDDLLCGWATRCKIERSLRGEAGAKGSQARKYDGRG